MSLIFKSVSIMQFNDEESLEVFIKSFPLPPEAQTALLARNVVTDEADRINVTGVKKLTHIFSIEGEE